LQSKRLTDCTIYAEENRLSGYKPDDPFEEPRDQVAKTPQGPIGHR
jgi:hypothetical protein